jgi:hypothetical protein
VPAVARAEPAADWTYPVHYRGKPAVGAKVGFAPFTYPTPGEPKAGELLLTTTDDKGEARLPQRDDGTAPSFVRVLARDAAGRGGYGMLSGANGRFPPTIDLLENTELTGRLTDADGKPVPGLTLKPVALGPESFARFDGRPMALADTPDWFWAAFPPTVAADGSFTLAGVPAGHSVAVRFEAPGFGSGRFWVVPGKAAAVALPKAGAIRLRFAAPPGTRPGDIRVTATRTATPDYLEATANGTAAGGADLTLTGLPPGAYRIAFPYSEPAAVFPKAPGTVTVKPGETAEVTAALEPAARLTARLVDSRTGKGVAGAKLSATVTRGPEEYVSVPAAPSDAEGHVTLVVPAGMAQVTPGAAEGYAVVPFSDNPFNRSATEAVPVAPGQSHDFGTFALVRTVDLAGVVVDEAGQPVAGAKVQVGYTGTNFYRGKPIVSDAQGRFVIAGMNPGGGAFGVTAARGKAITAAPVAVDPAKPGAALRLVVSERFAARVRVRAVDRTGRPVVGVQVQLAHSVMYLAQGAGAVGDGTAMPVASTPADGRFESDVLQPGDRYGITLSAPGYRGSTTPDWLAVPGETHDYGDVVLTRASLAVTGTVTDRDGRAVAGAAVFDNADGPKPVATTTDAAGRFTLTGFYEGPAIVCVRAAGFRLAAFPAEAGGPPVACPLRRLTDPPAPPPALSADHRAATVKLTRHLLEALWTNRTAANDDGKLVLRAMATFDPPTARKWRDEEKARTGGAVDLTPEIAAVDRERTLLATAKDDPDEAVALLKEAGGRDGFRAVCRLAGQLLPDAPGRALRVAEEAVVRARGMPEADRPWALAEAGELVVRAGKTDAGRKLIEEAARLVEPLGFDGLDGYRRGMVACRLARFDPTRCRALIDPIQQASEFNRYLALACPRVAEADLPLARKWLADFRPDNSYSQHTARQRVAYRLARINPDEAVSVAEAIEDQTVRAVTLAGLATRLADRTRAAKLIDTVLDRIVADPAGYANGGADGTAALVLYRAKQIGHPDLAALRDKVLAARPSPPTGPFATTNGPNVTPALALALTDPDTARLLLARTLAAKDLPLPDLWRNREPLLALALADPAAAVPVVDRLVAVAVKQRKGYQYTGLDALASTLADPDRLADHVIRYGRLFGDFEEE